jgi:hypothetical protein
MAEATTIWIDFDVEDLESVMPEGIERGDLVIEGAFSSDKGTTLTVEFVKPDTK